MSTGGSSCGTSFGGSGVPASWGGGGGGGVPASTGVVPVFGRHTITPSGNPVHCSPAGQTSSSLCTHLARHVPAVHSCAAVHALCGFHTVQPVGAVSHFEGAPVSHFAAPSVHWFWQGGMHAPPWHVSPAAHAPPAAHTGQPLAVAWQTSRPPLAAQRFAPTVQLTGHVAHEPPLHEVPAWQTLPAFHVVQLFASSAQLSVELPLQRAAPTVQVVPQTPHAPPLQKLVQLCVACHVVQPWVSATHVSTFVPLQRFAPAVHVELHVEQLPDMQRVPCWQDDWTQLVQPVSTFQSHVCTPVAVHCEALMVHETQLAQVPLLHSAP